MQVRKVAKLFIVSILGIGLLFPSSFEPVDALSRKLFTEGFEDGISKAWYFEKPANVYSGSVASNVSLEGNASYRFELRKTDDLVYGGKRTEMRLPAERPLEDHIYSFGVLLPNSGDEDYLLDPEGSEIIAQWHNVPDSNESWTTPPLALKTYNGRYILERCWDDANITSNSRMTRKGYRAIHDLGSYEEDKGKFVKWKLRVKWGWKSSQNPKLEVYKDDKLVLQLNGLPNTTNDQSGVYFKVGLYKWEWASITDTSILDRRVIYFDNITVR